MSTVTTHIFGYLAILYDFSIWLYLGSFKNLVSEFTTMTNKTVFLNLGLTQLQYKVIFPSFVTFVHTILDTRKQSNSSEGGKWGAEYKHLFCSHHQLEQLHFPCGQCYPMALINIRNSLVFWCSLITVIWIPTRQNKLKYCRLYVRSRKMVEGTASFRTMDKTGPMTRVIYFTISISLFLNFFLQ